MEIISKFKEKPKTKWSWRAMYLGLSAFLMPPVLGFYGAVVAPIVVNFVGELAGRIIGFSIGMGALALSVSALVFSVRAYRMGERSWIMWVGFVPSALICAFWVFMIVGEFVFPH